MFVTNLNIIQKLKETLNPKLVQRAAETIPCFRSEVAVDGAVQKGDDEPGI
jgi:hypothetical protein